MKCKGAHASKPPTGPPCAHENMRGTRQGPPALPDVQDSPVVACNPNKFVVLADRKQLARSHQAVVSCKEVRSKVHSISFAIPRALRGDGSLIVESHAGEGDAADAFLKIRSGKPAIAHTLLKRRNRSLPPRADS